MNLCVGKVEKITLCCVILHNYLLSENNILYLNNEIDKYDNTGKLIEDVELPTFIRQGGKRSSVIATNISNEYMRYFNNEGAVDWQHDAIQKCNI